MSEPPAVGTQVEVQGLKARGDLNGKRGWVIGYDEDADRVEVSFEGASCQKVKLKPINAVPVAMLQSAIDGLAVGVCVEIVGLQSRADLNGRRGSIMSRDDVAGRIEVQLDGLATNERVKIKPGNAKLANDGFAIGAQVEISDLQSRADLNGRHGVIIAREVAVDLHGNDRLVLHLDGPSGGERIKCKLANVKLISMKLDLGQAVEKAAAAARLKAQSRNKDPCPDEGLDRRCQDRGPAPPSTQRDRAERSQDEARMHCSQRPSDRGHAERRGDGERDGGHQRHRSRDRDRGRGRERDRGQDHQPERSRSRPRSAPVPAPAAVSGVVEDRTRDWVCVCGQRNFVKRSECFRCSAPRTGDAPIYKGVSHLYEKRFAQQSRPAPRPFGGPLGEWTAAKDLLGKEDWDALRKRVDAKSAKRGSRKKARRELTSSSSSSSSEASGSSSSARSRKNSGVASSTTIPANPELDKLKEGALQRLLKLRDEPLPTRKKLWRALLLEFHPDKHPDDKENSTAVFQFLQKGKGLLDLKGTVDPSG